MTDRLEIRAARILLDNDHYAMEKLKKRVLEYLAVRQLKNNLKGPILCFVGPPGVGKTSVGRSIAKTLGREFHRIALGGVCDQSDIRGHRCVFPFLLRVICYFTTEYTDYFHCSADAEKFYLFWILLSLLDSLWYSVVLFRREF